MKIEVYLQGVDYAVEYADLDTAMSSAKFWSMHGHIAILRIIGQPTPIMIFYNGDRYRIDRDKRK